MGWIVTTMPDNQQGWMLMHKCHRLLAVAGISGVLMLSACGHSAERVSPGAPSKYAGGAWPADSDILAPVEQVTEEWLPRGMNDIVWSSYIGLVGTVTSTHDVDVPAYLGYAEVTLRVEQVLYTNESWIGSIPNKGDAIQFGQRRPKDTASSVGGLPPDLSPIDRYGPPLPVGTRLVVMLSTGPITVAPGKSIETLLPSHGYQSIWTANLDGAAVSVQPSRTVGLDELLAQVHQERERGRTDLNNPAAFADDQLTVDNPLGAPVRTTSPALPTTFALPTLPEVVASPTDLALTLDSADGPVKVMLRGTAAGGIDIAITVGGGSPTGVAAPTAASQEGKPLMVPLPSGEFAVVMVGAPGLSVDNVQVSIDGAGVRAVSGTWDREGTRPIIAFIAARASDRVQVLGLIPGPALAFDLIAPKQPEPPISTPPEVGVTTTTAKEQPVDPTTTTP
jgi:hypothetical protein